MDNDSELTVHQPRDNMAWIVTLFKASPFILLALILFSFGFAWFVYTNCRISVPEAHIAIVRNGPEPDRIRPVPPDRKLRAKAPNLIGYVGEMGVHDGVDYLLSALSHLKHRLGRTDFYAVLIGTGDEWDNLRQLAIKLDIAELVWFTGRVSDADLVSYLSKFWH